MSIIILILKDKFKIEGYILVGNFISCYYLHYLLSNPRWTPQRALQVLHPTPKPNNEPRWPTLSHHHRHRPLSLSPTTSRAAPSSSSPPQPPPPPPSPSHPRPLPPRPSPIASSWTSASAPTTSSPTAPTPSPPSAPIPRYWAALSWASSVTSFLSPSQILSHCVSAQTPPHLLTKTHSSTRSFPASTSSPAARAAPTKARSARRATCRATPRPWTPRPSRSPIPDLASFRSRSPKTTTTTKLNSILSTGMLSS